MMPRMSPTSPEQGANLLPERDIFTVSRLNREARGLLERGFGSVWLEGEISNLSRPASGHWYFSLKDDAAQVRCCMFRSRNHLVRLPVVDGAKVVARGRVSLYEARGEFQVVVEHIEEAGEGLLRRRFEELKQRLAAETSGRLRRMPRVSRVERSTSIGRTSERAGTSRTSSKVSASSRIRSISSPWARERKRGILSSIPGDGNPPRNCALPSTRPAQRCTRNARRLAGHRLELDASASACARRPQPR